MREIDSIVVVEMERLPMSRTEPVNQHTNSSVSPRLHHVGLEVVVRQIFPKDNGGKLVAPVPERRGERSLDQFPLLNFPITLDEEWPAKRLRGDWGIRRWLIGRGRRPRALVGEGPMGDFVVEQRLEFLVDDGDRHDPFVSLLQREPFEDALKT